MQTVQNQDIKEELTGSSFSCTWRSPLGYKLKTDIKISEVKPKSMVRLDATGDLEGSVICDLKDYKNGTLIKITWEVDTKLKWMNTFKPFLKPIFVASHHKVMANGLQGFNNYLTNKYKNPAN